MSMLIVTEAKAREYAAVLGAHPKDDTWTYEAVPVPGGWAVRVTDNDGSELGYL